MMKKNNISKQWLNLMGLALLGGLASCSSEMDLTDVLSPAPAESKMMTITATLDNSDPESRMVIEELTNAAQQNYTKMTWEEDETLRVIPMPTDGSVDMKAEGALFTLTSGAGSGQGKFKGSVSESDYGYRIFYPASKIKCWEDWSLFSYEGQVQTGNGDYSHLKNFFIMGHYMHQLQDIRFTSQDYEAKWMDVAGIYHTSDVHGSNFRQSSVMKFVVRNLPQEFVPTSLTLDLKNAQDFQGFMWKNGYMRPSETSLKLELNGFEPTDEIVAYMTMTSENVILPANAILRMTVKGTKDGNPVAYSQEQTLPEEVTLEGGKMHRLVFKDTAWEDGYYESSDFSKDGEVWLNVPASVNPNNIPLDVVIMGDGYTDKELEKYEADVNSMAEEFFSIQPMKAYRNYFNVYSSYAISKTHKQVEPLMNGAVDNGGETVFSSLFTENSTGVSGDDKEAVDRAVATIAAAEGIAVEDIDANRKANMLVLVLINVDTHAGTCYNYSSDNPYDFGYSYSVSYIPMNSNLTARRLTFLHESVGHGFGKLGDEYVAYQYPSDVVPYKAKYSNVDSWLTLDADHGRGFWMNVDKYFVQEDETMNYASYYKEGLTALDATTVNWREFIGEDYPEVSAFEGAFTWDKYFCRPTQESIMRNQFLDDESAHIFNAPSRRAIWYRINKFIDAEFVNDFETFKAWDMAHQELNTRMLRPASTKLIPGTEGLKPLPRPVVRVANWK